MVVSQVNKTHGDRIIFMIFRDPHFSQSVSLQVGRNLFWEILGDAGPLNHEDGTNTRAHEGTHST